MENREVMAPAYVYMVRCEGGQLYTGWTTDPAARLHAHKTGQLADPAPRCTAAVDVELKGVLQLDHGPDLEGAGGGAPVVLQEEADQKGEGISLGQDQLAVALGLAPAEEVPPSVLLIAGQKLIPVDGHTIHLPQNRLMSA